MPKQKFDKLPKRFKEKFVAALRSGKYRKCTGELYNPEKNTYCILGVAGAVAQVSKKKLKDNDDLEFTTYRYGKNNKVPKTLRGEGENPVDQYLMGQNDNNVWSFRKAADWIEKNL